MMESACNIHCCTQSLNIPSKCKKWAVNVWPQILIWGEEYLRHSHPAYVCVELDQHSVVLPSSFSAMPTRLDSSTKFLKVTCDISTFWMIKVRQFERVPLLVQCWICIHWKVKLLHVYQAERSICSAQVWKPRLLLLGSWIKNDSLRLQTKSRSGSYLHFFPPCKNV